MKWTVRHVRIYSSFALTLLPLTRMQKDLFISSLNKIDWELICSISSYDLINCGNSVAADT